MAATLEIAFLFVCFVLVWLRRRQIWRSRSRTRRALALRRRLEAFYDQQDEDLREILAAYAADRLVLSTLQLRSVWVRSRSQAFETITASWSDATWNGKGISAFPEEHSITCVLN